MNAIDPFLFWGLIGAAVCVIAYLIRVGIFKKQKPDLVDALGIFFSFIAIVGGVKVGLLSATASIHGQSVVLKGEDIWIALGGCLALIWISIIGIIRTL